MQIMKTSHLLPTLILLFFVHVASAQLGINYKAIIHDAGGNVLVNAPVTVQFTILENGTTIVYQETHRPTTNDNGIVIVNIGEGTPVSGDFSVIGWGGNPHYIKTEINTGEGYIDMGTTEFKTVPYALHAKTVASTADLIFLASLQKGDKVKTVGGIHGKINDVKEDYVMMEIADLAVIKVDKMAIRRITY
jgi:hypothetical protein